MSDRPLLRALIIRPLGEDDCRVGKVGMVLLNGEREVLGGVVTLTTPEEVARLRDLGLQLFVDPGDEAVLARWNQINSPRQPWNKW